LLTPLSFFHDVVLRSAARLPFGERIADAGKLLSSDPVERYFRIRGLMDGTERKRFFTERVSDDPAWVFRKFYRNDLPPVHRLLALDLMTYLPDNNLALVDRAAMAHGLEVRVPFLDQSLVEFAFGLPESCLIQPGQTKILFRRAIQDLLPKEVLGRRKYGFSPPFKGWLRGPEREAIFRMIEKGSLAADGIIRPGAIRKFVERGHARRYSKLWAVLTLEIWYRRWIVGNASSLREPIAP
jgi:asparagine synthase (glutamine-hydrolysing)